jgi:pilus assembly protein CpaF
MRVWYYNQFGGERAAVSIASDRFTIGRDEHNEVVLSSHSVAEEALVITRLERGWQLETRGRNGCQLGGSELQAGDQAALHHGDIVGLYPFVLEFEICPTQAPVMNRSFSALESQAADWLTALHVRLLKMVEPSFLDQARRGGNEATLRLEHCIDELARQVGPQGENLALLTWYVAGKALQQALLDLLLADSPDTASPLRMQREPWMQLVSAVPEREHELVIMIDQISEELRFRHLGSFRDRITRLDEEFWDRWEIIAQSLLAESFHYLVHRSLKKQLKDILFGYGPLEDLICHPQVSEIMVVGKDKIYVEKNGIIEPSGRRFVSDDVTLAVIERIVGQVGRRIDMSQPVIDARLKDGSRVHAVVPPIAVDGPCLTIRRFVRSFTFKDLIDNDTISSQGAGFLKSAVIAKKGILVTGGAGSGKTTLLNCLAGWIPSAERIITIEDTCELQLQHEHVVRLETKLPNAEGSGAYVTRDLVRQSLRMRPDRIVVGECRGAEALDMLQAMNTGHEGCMTTVHANSPADVIPRLETMVQMAADFPIDAIQRQIEAAIDLIVHVERLEGRRRVTRIAEVAGIDRQQGRLRIKELFALEDSPLGLRLQPTGRIPSFASQLLAAGWFDLTGFQRDKEQAA